MKHTSMHFDGGFEVGFTLRDVQAAQMVLAPGTHTGGPHNRHVGADQWLYVVGGAGEAVVDGARQPLQAGSLLGSSAAKRTRSAAPVTHRCARSTFTRRRRMARTANRSMPANADARFRGWRELTARRSRTKQDWRRLAHEDAHGHRPDALEAAQASFEVRAARGRVGDVAYAAVVVVEQCFA
jgi:hypothetical protein